MRPSRVAWAQVSWPACHLTKASASAVMRGRRRGGDALRDSVSPARCAANNAQGAAAGLTSRDALRRARKSKRSDWQTVNRPWPADVARSVPAPVGLGSDSMTPNRSSCLSRCESSVRESPGAPCSISLKLPQPRCRLRMIQRCPGEDHVRPRQRFSLQPEHPPSLRVRLIPEDPKYGETGRLRSASARSGRTRS